MTNELTPLEEIEQLVQARARQISLDMDDEAAAKALERFVDEEIRRWNDDFRRGARPFRVTDTKLLAERAMRNLMGYGAVGPAASGRRCVGDHDQPARRHLREAAPRAQRLPPRGVPRR